MLINVSPEKTKAAMPHSSPLSSAPGMARGDSGSTSSRCAHCSSTAQFVHPTIIA
jgi:hypothetical protein